MRQFIFLEPIVQGNGNNCHFSRGTPRLHYLGTIVHQDGDSVSRFNAKSRETIGQGIGAAVELPKSDNVLVHNERGSVRSGFGMGGNANSFRIKFFSVIHHP
jgi:hypothetical protein